MSELELVHVEDLELTQMRAQLSACEMQLAERELALATLQAELRTFEAQYFCAFGARFAERDELEAQIAEAVALNSPNSERLQDIATEARQKARETGAESAARPASSQREAFKPSEPLRSLYREIAKRIHPDLATDHRDRGRRTDVMAEANLAYAAGDEPRLREILHKWEESPESVCGLGVAAEMARTSKKIHQIRQRLSWIVGEMATLKQSELSHLKTRFEAAGAAGWDLWADMREELEMEIEQLRVRLGGILTHRDPS